MSRLFYNLGRKLGPKVRKAKWLWQSMTGTEADAIKAENDLGRDLAHEVRLQLKPDPDPQAGELLATIGRRLARCVANRFRTFSFEVVKGREPNAFALPGGFIFVTRPIIDLCRADPDETAFVLAHEMAHVIRGHAMTRILSNSAISTAARVTPTRSVLAAWLKKVGIRFIESAYSRDLESEADRLAIRLAHAAGYDPEAAVKLLGRLADLSRPPGQFELGPYFSSHPPYKARIQYIKDYLESLTR